MAMSIVKYKNEAPIYQILANGEILNTIKYREGEVDKALLPLSAQDKTVVQNFYDSTGTYIQLRVIQVIPLDTEGTPDNSRENRLFLFAQNKLSEDDEDKLGYIGSIRVDSNFKLSTVQELINDPTFTLNRFNHTYQFTYQDFDGSGSRTVVFGDVEFSKIIKNINGIDYLCLYDVNAEKRNGETDKTDTWSILYIPYINNMTIEVLMFAMLKNTITPINEDAQPIIDLEYIKPGLGSEDNDIFEFYNMDQTKDYFFSAKSAAAASPTNINVDEIESARIVLNKSADLIDTESEEEMRNPYVWPLVNKEYDSILALKNCYFTFDGEKWYPVLETKGDNKHCWIDLENLPESVELPKGDEFKQFKITDKESTDSLNGNGNILLQAYNTLSIMILNNSLAFEKTGADLRGPQMVPTEVEIQEYKNNVLYYNYNNKTYCSPLELRIPIEDYRLKVYDTNGNEMVDWKLAPRIVSKPPIYLRVYKEG